MVICLIKEGLFRQEIMLVGQRTMEKFFKKFLNDYCSVILFLRILVYYYYEMFNFSLMIMVINVLILIFLIIINVY